MKIEINASKREAQGTGASRRLRRAGRVPGISTAETSSRSISSSITRIC